LGHGCFASTFFARILKIALSASIAQIDQAFSYSPFFNLVRFNRSENKATPGSELISNHQLILQMPNESLPYKAPTLEEIATCAYFIWEAEGRPVDREISHWFQAQAHLIATRKMDAGLLKSHRPTKRAGAKSAAHESDEISMADLMRILERTPGRRFAHAVA
jgi:hypothetical protein